MDWLWQDIKFGFRSLFKDRGFLVTSVLALALGIGSTTAIFSVIDNVLFEPFPYTDGQRLTSIDIRDSGSHDQYGREAFSQPEFLDFQEQNHVFHAVVGVRQDRVLMTNDPTRPESFNAATVTGNTFQFLGVPPLLGRGLTPNDAKPGAAAVTVLSHKLWKRRFNADPNVIGTNLILNGKPTTVVGVMPLRFAFWGADLWMATTLDRGETDPNAPWFFLLGHLRPGLTLKAAEPDIAALAVRLSKIYPKNYPKRFDVQLRSLVDNVVGKFRETLYTLLAAVGLLLLIACGNVANLLLARATAREREFAIRNSLGASRLTVIRQLLVESILLALMSAAVGCGLAWGGLKLLVSAIPKYTFPDEANIHLNGRVLAATIAVAIATALIFGLIPAIGSFTWNLSEPLKAGGRGTSGFRRGRLRNLLIVTEVALSLILLTGAGLMMRSFILERQAELGMRTEKLLTTQIWFGKKYKSAEEQSRFLRELKPRLQALPGVISVSGAVDFPPFGGINTDFEAAGTTHSEKWKGQMAFCDPEFLSTVGARLLRGRILTADDVNGKRRAAVVNQTLAAKFFPGQDPLGKQIELLGLERAPTPIPNPWFEIVGVTSDIKNHGVREAVLPEAYAPYTLSSFGGFIVYLRTVGNPKALASALDGQVMAMDKTLLPQQTNSMDEALELYEYGKQRFWSPDIHGLCNHRAHSCHRWGVQRGVLHRLAAEPRDWHSDGSRRDSRQCARARSGGRHALYSYRRGNRSFCSVRASAPAGKSDIWDLVLRPSDACRSSCFARLRRDGSLSAPVAPGDPSRSARFAAVRVILPAACAGPVALGVISRLAMAQC